MSFQLYRATTTPRRGAARRGPSLGPRGQAALPGLARSGGPDRSSGRPPRTRARRVSAARPTRAPGMWRVCGAQLPTATAAAMGCGCPERVSGDTSAPSGSAAKKQVSTASKLYGGDALHQQGKVPEQVKRASEAKRAIVLIGLAEQFARGDLNDSVSRASYFGIGNHGSSSAAATLRPPGAHRSVHNQVKPAPVLLWGFPLPSLPRRPAPTHAPRSWPAWRGVLCAGTQAAMQGQRLSQATAQGDLHSVRWDCSRRLRRDRSKPRACLRSSLGPQERLGTGWHVRQKHVLAKVCVESTCRVHLPAMRPIPGPASSGGRPLQQGAPRWAGSPTRFSQKPPRLHRLEEALSRLKAAVREVGHAGLHDWGPCAPRIAGRVHRALPAAWQSARHEVHRRAAYLPSKPAAFSRWLRHVRRHTLVTWTGAACAARGWHGGARTWRGGANCNAGPAALAVDGGACIPPACAPSHA